MVPDSVPLVVFGLLNLIAILTSLRVGHHGGYTGTGLFPCCGRAWATAVKWLFLVTIVAVGILAVGSSLSNGRFDLLFFEVMVPYASLAVLFLAFLFLPVTALTAFLAYNFGAQKRVREELSRNGAGAPDS